MKQSVKRLIQWFVPESYSLHITQSAQKLTFEGAVDIKGELTETAIKEGTIYLHVSDLDVTDVTINGQTADFHTDNSAQLLEIKLPKLVKNISICVKFRGTISPQMHGLYPSTYMHDGQTKTLLATQFESHHAREVFPCVDEPEAKATFELTITTEREDTVVSNTPIAVESKNGTQKTVTFEATPRMSTYLLAWVSGELIYVEAISGHGVQVRTYATPVHKGKLDYSVDVLCRAMDYLDDYFDIPYPLKKFDQIALPDFAAGAMENWGCVTFRESALLYDPSHSDLSDKQHVAEVVTHELAHQWFGNLVTMRWWNDLWLNEGFASWIPYLVLDDLYPEWNMWEHFATGDLSNGLRVDALEHTHPIVVEIHSPEEIRSAFDAISYDKGCSVINLLYHYIGPEAFREGLRIYLKRHAYKNAQTDDLWAAWGESSGQDVVGFMKTWTETPGFPLVTVSNNGLSQERFFINPNARKTPQVWPIPLMRESSDTTIFDAKTISIKVGQKLNKGQSGFYRTIYRGSLGEELITTIGSAQASDIVGLLGDTSESAKAGYIETSQMLTLADKVKENQSEIVIGTVLSELAEIRSVFPELHEVSLPFLGAYVSPSFKRLGIKEKKTDSIDDTLLRPSVVGSMALAGDDSVLNYLKETYENASRPEDLPKDLRPQIYGTVARTLGTKKEFQTLLSWYISTTIPGERASLAGALCQFKDPEIFSSALGLIRSEDVKLQDSLYWVVYALGNRYNRSSAWDWVKANWDWVAENFSKEKEIDYYLRFCARGFATEQHLADYTDFFTSVDIFGSNRAFEQGKEIISWQSAWKSRELERLKQFFVNFTN